VITVGSPIVSTEHDWGAALALRAAARNQVVVRVRSGTLLIFASWLEHSVDANLNPAERVMVSFNVMWSSFAEQLSQPLWSGQPSS